MYKIRWWFEQGSWECTVSRQIGPKTFQSKGYISDSSATVETCSVVEQQCLNEVKHDIIEEGGVV